MLFCLFPSLCIPFASETCYHFAQPLDFYGYRFKDQSEMYYHSKVMPPGFATDVTYYLHVLAISSDWRQACFPEAVHVLALKLAELAYLSDHDSAKTFFIDQIGTASRHCSPCDLWFHTKSLLLDIGQVMTRPRLTHSIDFVASYCGASSHSPGAGFAAYTDSVAWLRTLLEQTRTSGRLRLFLMEKCTHRATDAERQERYAGLTQSISDLISDIRVEIVTEEIRADDCTAYLKFISEHYDDLSDFVLFIHPDIEEHAMMSLVERVVKSILTGFIRTDELPFLYLSHNYLDLEPERNNLWETYAAGYLWKKIFKSTVIPHRSRLKAYCCSQFVVSSERIKLRTRSFYTEALRVFEKGTSYTELSPFTVVTQKYDVICRTPCQLNMPWWHIYFGEDLTYSKISQRPDIPLFIRLLVSDEY